MKQKTKINTNGTKRLAILLGLAGVDGAVALAAVAGLFTIGNALLIAVLFMAGPGAITLAALIDGSLKERMLSALLAGVIATCIVMLSAGFGPKILGFVNLNVLRVIGGISIGLVALLVAGVKIPNNLPLGVMATGLVLSFILR
ncbi:MAG: hypothetical protein WC796_03815 [Candidatus Pacearchaeota archaeon]|jgi:hypothetical protein